MNICLCEYPNKFYANIQIPRLYKAFRSGSIDIVAGTTNGIESNHKVFKARYLHKKSTYNLFSMLQILIKYFFPSRYISKCNGSV